MFIFPLLKGETSLSFHQKSAEHRMFQHERRYLQQQKTKKEVNRVCSAILTGINHKPWRPLLTACEHKPENKTQYQGALANAFSFVRIVIFLLKQG